jgi:uncharacterized protein (DUF885 family)
VKVFVAGLVVLLVFACGPSERPDVPRPLEEPSPQMLRDAATAFGALRDGFVEWYLETHPVRASELGIREHDGRLPGMDRTSIQRRIDALLDWEAQLQRIPMRLMREGDRLDYAVLEYGIRAELLDLEEIRRWVLNPGEYTGAIAGGITTVAEQRYAPPAERAAALRSRLEAAPELLAAARSNLRGPPAAWVESGIVHGRLLLRYVEEELPGILAAEPGWDASLAVVEPARLALADSLRVHVAWLERDLLPGATGQFRLGRYLFARELLYGDHVVLSMEELARLNEEELSGLEEQVAAVAAEIDRGRGARAVMDSLWRSRPDPAVLVLDARRDMEAARDWLVRTNVVSLPESAVPLVREAPSYARQEPASLTSPGPLGASTDGAFYNIAPPQADWPEARRHAHMAAFHAGALTALTLHHTYPGRYLHEQHARAAPNPLRQIFLPRSLTGGWALYAGEMALEHGFQEGDLVVRAAQLRRSLVAQARWYAALQVHVMGRSPEAVVERVMELAFLDQEAAAQEVTRATLDPGSLTEGYGQIRIRQLRQAYEEFTTARDQEFSLREFHDRFLEQSLPLVLAAEALMPSPAQREVQRLRGGRVVPLMPTW